MIGYYTDNAVSQGVMAAVAKSGIETRHVRYYSPNETPIFYGILRGTGRLMMDSATKPYYYLDNGYFDAVYMDSQKRKDMSGKYRVVKNEMVEKYKGPCVAFRAPQDMKVLVLPPSPYTAFMYDTTPEDWVMEQAQKCESLGYWYAIRTKENKDPLTEDLKQVNAVLAFNSMSVMTAIDCGIPAFDTHGVLRNYQMFGECLAGYDIDDMREFYRDKDFTLEEIAKGDVKWLS